MSGYQIVMAPVILSLLCCVLLLDHQLGLAAPAAPDSSHVFLSGQAADNVLRRHKRHNTGLFEEWQQGNLERECLEERCDLEEAREAFEDDELTMEFWVGYIDGDQCKSSPCQNQGECKDHLGSYTCSCLSGSTGRNCEIFTARVCSVNNGECMHFCESMGTFGGKCSCAEGYKLSKDGVNCEPTAEYPCGRDVLTVISGMSTRSLFENDTEVSLGNGTLLTNMSSNATATPILTAASTAASSPAAEDSTSAPSQSRLPLFEVRESSIPLNKTMNDKKRIVGGESVIPGEIPWQVALVARPSGQVFCGGAILSELWVVTAAHCLVEGQGSFFVRVGEHNVYIEEGTEQDHEVSEQRVHPRYQSQVSLYNNDIALVRLQTPIVFSATARPICLGPKAFTEAIVTEASPATVSGWGRTRFHGATSSTLQKVEVPFMDRTECKDSSSARITRYMFCAGYYDTEKDSCQGDSGGPHANRFHDTWFLTGIISWGEECAKEGKYGVYTRVSHYYRWIRYVMERDRSRLAVANDVDEPDP